VREGAWRAVAERRLADRDALDDIFDKMIERRDALAGNAGCRGSGAKGPLRVGPFVEFAFKEKHRFDYTPADCRSFWAAVEKHVVPMMRRLDEHRRRSLGLGSLRPWDMAVDLKGRTGLRPFEGGRELFDKSVNVMEALDPRLGGLLRRLGLGAPATPDPARGFVSECLDLDSRKGKRPGGYMYVRDRSRTPFIFMNSAGLHRDVMTMVHEAGHAFHSMLAGPEWLLDYRDSPTEFAEVASMSMEHLTMPHWATNGQAGASRFYAQKQDADRARREHLEDSIMILAWIATIDSFQHWIYADPKHTRTQRDDYWLELDQRFGHALDWDGLDDHHRCVWQRQGHLFSHPMYYIEYGIAQLGAFQLWLKSVKEGETAAVDAYIRALRLGGSRPLPELFAAAGIRFDFGESTVASIVEAAERQLETLDR
jgi:oligoendopeptidase F